MASIGEIGKISEKWARVTPQRTEDYTDGVTNPRVDWRTATEAANAAWKEGVQKAAGQDLFVKGVRRVGTEKWQGNTVAKGPTRWQQGIGLGQGAYEAGFAPFRDAIARVSLPQRFPRRDPRNLQRVEAIVKALINAKLGGGAGGRA